MGGRLGGAPAGRARSRSYRSGEGDRKNSERRELHLLPPLRLVLPNGFEAGPPEGGHRLPHRPRSDVETLPARPRHPVQATGTGWERLYTLRSRSFAPGPPRRLRATATAQEPLAEVFPGN